MIRPLFLVGALAMLSGCADDPAPSQPATAAEPVPVAEEAPQASVPAEATGFAYSPVPEGVTIEMPYHVRYDRIATTKSGELRRRAMLELLEPGAEGVLDAIGDQLVAAGYRRLEVKGGTAEAPRAAFTRKGAGRINLAVKPEVGAKPSNPDAKALLLIDWRVAAPASATDSGS